MADVIAMVADVIATCMNGLMFCPMLLADVIANVFVYGRCYDHCFLWLVLLPWWLMVLPLV